MHLGEKLKAARLEAGLSQRQLCADVITRNMLSQIENGTASPSNATLRALCARLGKPMQYFRPDAPSENLSVLHRAQCAPPEEALKILEEYLSPDPVLDGWYNRLIAQCRMALAEQAVAENRIGYARQLLERVSRDYAEPVRWAVLRHRCQMDSAEHLAAMLPDNTRECALRANAALQQKDLQRCIAFLDTADRQTEEIRLLRGRAFMECKDYTRALECLLSLEQSADIYALLEICCRELGDFQKAYEYACKQR